METLEELEQRKLDIKMLLLRRGLSQTRLAKKIGINFTMLNQFVNGWLRLKEESLKKFCKELKIDCKSFKAGKIKDLK